MRDLKIIFMGTPDFAVVSLDALLKAEFHVVGVVTAPDKKAGRGRKTQISAVKKYAIEHQLPVFQPTNLKSEEFTEQLKKLKTNLQIIVAFRMLPKVVWNLPQYGTFNLHASLLPNYRGAAPINWAIINGETKTGVTTFFIDEEIDTGNIILQEETLITDDDTVGELHDKLMVIGSSLVVKTVRLIEMGPVQTIQQPNLSHQPAPKIFKETCRINWNESLTNIFNLIRGLNPYPASWTILQNDGIEIDVKIFDVKKELIEHQLESGKLLCSKNEIKVAVKSGFLILESLQLAGKKKMDSKSLLNGFAFHENAKMI